MNRVPYRLPNHPAAGKAGIAPLLAIEHHWLGRPEPGRSANQTMANPTKISRKEFEKFDGVRWNAMNDMCALSDIGDLTPVQRVAHLAYWYMSEVENGGHHQYFLNKADFDQDEVVQALAAVGAREHAEILRDALNQVRASPLGTPQTVEQFLESEDAADLTDYDSAFAKCRPSVFDCLQTYLDKHEADFIEWIP